VAQAENRAGHSCARLTDRGPSRLLKYRRSEVGAARFWRL